MSGSRKRPDYARAIVETVREPLLILDGDLRVKSANRAFYQNFQVTPGETEDRFLYELMGRQWDIPRLRTLLEDVLPKEASFQDYEVDQTFAVIGRRRMLLNGRKIREKAVTPDSSSSPSTTSPNAGGQGRSCVRVENVTASSSRVPRVMAFSLSTPRGVITTWNLGAEKILGYAEAEILGKNLEVIFMPEDCEAGQLEFMMRKAAADGQALDERWHVRKGGEKFWANGLVMPLKDDAGETRGYLKILQRHDRAAAARKCSRGANGRDSRTPTGARMNSWRCLPTSSGTRSPRSAAPCSYPFWQDIDAD